MIFRAVLFVIIAILTAFLPWWAIFLFCFFYLIFFKNPFEILVIVLFYEFWFSEKSGGFLFFPVISLSGLFLIELVSFLKNKFLNI